MGNLHLQVRYFVIKTYPSLNSKSIIKLIWRLIWKISFEGKMETGMLRVLRAETVWSGFHSLPFSRISLKNNPKTLFSSSFLFFGGGSYWQKSCTFCLLQMNAKEKNTDWNIAFCLWPITYMHAQVLTLQNSGWPPPESSTYNYELIETIHFGCYIQLLGAQLFQNCAVWTLQFNRGSFPFRILSLIIVLKTA